MTLKDRIILEDFRKNRENFLELEKVVDKILHNIVKLSGIKEILGIEHRVKTEQSLAGKLVRNGDWYSTLEDLTDLLGARVICYFSDEVDKIGKLVEQSFTIDWENSSDKRALIKADTFGYLSLHYICSLPDNGEYPKELCDIRFEIQIRTVLQHAWAAINHDIGYKSEFGVPRAVTRQFSRIAGLLELADEEFMRTRDTMELYTEETRNKIINNEADDVLIDMVSLKEYVTGNKKMQHFLSKLADISGADVDEVNSDNYVEQLQFLGKTTIGDLQVMLEENEELALKLADRVLSRLQMDLVSSSVGLRFLCRAELLNKGYSMEKAKDFITLSVKDDKRAGRQAKRLFDIYKKMEGK